MATKARVIVGMSGGVDSSVAARLLQEQGYEVLGLTLRLADPFIRGESKQSRVVERARTVCERLGIEHCVEDRTDAFDTCVVRYFADAYFEGSTPNPCVQCNARVKWRALLEIADERDAGYVATGHYARISNEHGRFRLLKGRDTLKDQSYFLWRLNAKQLSRTLFPLGDLTKAAVRTLAGEQGLPSAGQSESQDICFINDNNYKAFLGKYFPGRAAKAGEGVFIDKDARVLGRHPGYHRFTVGQRKGLGIALGKPVYVRQIDAEKNTVLLTDASGMEDTGCRVTDTHWIGMQRPHRGMDAEVKIRYRNKAVPCSIEPSGKDNYLVRFARSRKAVTPGQSAVFYDGDRVLGGGIILEAVREKGKHEEEH